MKYSSFTSFFVTATNYMYLTKKKVNIVDTRGKRTMVFWALFTVLSTSAVTFLTIVIVSEIREQRKQEREYKEHQKTPKNGLYYYW